MTGRHQCEVVTVGIRITGGAEGKDALGIRKSVEFETLEANLTSEISFEIIFYFNCEKLLFKKIHVLYCSAYLESSSS